MRISTGAAVYAARRLDAVSTADRSGAALGRRLRPAALDLARAAGDLCDRLETLGELEPGDEAPRTAHAWRDLVAQDARAVITAAIDEVDPPPNRPWPALPSAAADDRDVLLALFGIAANELTDDTGSFCDARVLAHYRLRLVELQRLCDPSLASSLTVRRRCSQPSLRHVTSPRASLLL